MSLCVAVLCFLFPVPPHPHPHPFFIISSCKGAKQVFGAVIKTILDLKKKHWSVLQNLQEMLNEEAGSQPNQ